MIAFLIVRPSTGNDRKHEHIKTQVRMTAIQTGLCLFFAASLAFGQVLFKFAALTWAANAARTQEPVLSIISPYFIAACISYGITAIVWIYILRDVPLTKAYIFSILGSAFVPLAGFYFFNEPIQAKYIIGFVLMLIGVFLCVT